MVLITGCSHSGTSWLCSLIGSHPDINMTYETADGSIARYAGKPINGNKLTTIQIDYNKRNKFIGIVARRLTRFLYGNLLWPKSELNYQDYINMGTVIIWIDRKGEDVISSLVYRDGITERLAGKIYEQSRKKLEALKPYIIYNTSYERLKEDKEKVCADIFKILGLKNFSVNDEYIFRYEKNKAEEWKK